MLLQDTDSGYSVQPDLAACQALCGNTQVDPLLEKTWSDPDDEYVMSHRVCYDSDRNEVHLALVTNHDADSASLTGTEEAMRAFCLTIPGCTAIHDAHRDGTNWRACCSVTAHAQLSADNYDCAPGSGVTGVLTGATHRSTDGNFEGCAALCDAAGSQTCGGFDYEPLTSGSHACRLYSWGGKIDWLNNPNTGQYHTRQYCVGRGRATVRTRVAVPPTACSAIIWGTPDAGSPNGADSYANHCYLYADPLPFDPVGQGCVLDDGFGYDTYAISMAQAPQSCLASYNNDAAFSPLCCDQTEWSVTRVDLNCHRSHTGVPNLLHASSNEFESLSRSACEAACRALPGCNGLVLGKPPTHDKRCYLRTFLPGTFTGSDCAASSDFDTVELYATSATTAGRNCNKYWPGVQDIYHASGYEHEVLSRAECEAACRARPGCNGFGRGVTGHALNYYYLRAFSNGVPPTVPSQGLERGPCLTLGDWLEYDASAGDDSGSCSGGYTKSCTGDEHCRQEAMPADSCMSESVTWNDIKCCELTGRCYDDGREEASLRTSATFDADACGEDAGMEVVELLQMDTDASLICPSEAPVCSNYANNVRSGTCSHGGGHAPPPLQPAGWQAVSCAMLNEVIQDGNCDLSCATAWTTTPGAPLSRAATAVPAGAEVTTAARRRGPSRARRRAAGSRTACSYGTS